MKIILKPSGILWLSVLFYVSSKTAFSFFSAMVIHELGHVFALYLLGKQPEQLTISITGCTISVYGLSYQEEIISAAAGPLMSLMSGLFYQKFPDFAVISLLLGGFNLLPVEGLDGGRILSGILTLKAPRKSHLIHRITEFTVFVMLAAAVICTILFPSETIFPLMGAVFLAKALFLIVSPDSL